MKSDDIKMSKFSLVILGVFLILSAVPTNSQQVACTFNADFSCTYASLYYFPPGPAEVSMIEVIGWVFVNITITNIGVRLYDSTTNHLYDWQLTPVLNTYQVTTAANQFFYAPWFSLAGLPKGSYGALFGIFDSNSNIVFDLPFTFVL